MAEPTAVQVQGWTAPGFEAVRDIAQRSLNSGAEAGLSVCAVKDGETSPSSKAGLSATT